VSPADKLAIAEERLEEIRRLEGQLEMARAEVIANRRAMREHLKALEYMKPRKH
jgi:hypothetical protein